MLAASKTVQSLYAAINQRDLPAAMAWVDEDCVYEDLNYPRAFTGKAAVQELFAEALAALPADLQFAIDDITTGDDWAVGLIWHVELGGVPFPNTRGASFYRCSPNSGLLVYARDVVESPIKPGRAAFTILRAVMPLARRWLARQNPTAK